MQNSKNMSFDNTEQYNPEISLGSAEDVKLWEEVRCPICMEHPHNAVLLRCSSFVEGCRPFMCNTSYRHSNCLDQFCNSSGSSPSTLAIQDALSARVNTHLIGQTDISELQPKLACPLCRGEIYGWFVVDPARRFMNSKLRSCSYENCEFAGNYLELRNHARSDHPTVRPLEVDPERQRNWARLECETDSSDLRELITLMNGGGRAEGDVEVVVDLGELSLANAHAVLIAESIIQILHIRRMGLELINAIGQDDDDDDDSSDHLEMMMPRDQNNHRQNSTRINFNSRQNNSSDNLGARTPRIQNHYGQNNGGNSFNSRRNSSFRTNLGERMHRNLNNCRHNNTSSNNLNSRWNNCFRANLPRNQNNYRGNNRNYRDNLNSRQNNSFTGNLTERMRQRRINNARQINNVSRRRRLDSWRSRHDSV